VKIPVTSNASFKEVLEDIDDVSADQPIGIEQLARLVDSKLAMFLLLKVSTVIY